MKLNIRKSLYILIMSGVLFSITGCNSSDKIQNTHIVENVKEKNDNINEEDIKLFNSIGINDSIINNNNFKKIIDKIKKRNYTLKEDTMFKNQIIAIYDENNVVRGAINQGITDHQLSANCSFSNDKYYDSYYVNYIYNISNDSTTLFSCVAYEYYYENDNVLNTYTKIYVDNILKQQSIQLEYENGNVFYIGLDKDDNSFTLNDKKYILNDNDFNDYFNKMKDCKKNPDLSKYIDYVTKDDNSTYLVKVK